MKKAFIGILGFYLVFHILTPFLVQFRIGFRPYYGMAFEFSELLTVVILNSTVVVVAILAIAYIPWKDEALNLKLRGTSVLYGISLILGLLVLVVFQGFEGILSGQANGTLMAYLGMFLESSTLLMLVLMNSRSRVLVLVSVLVFLVVKTLGGSRSAVISVFLIILMLAAVFPWRRLAKPLGLLVILGIALTPLLFFTATFQRNGYLENDKLGYFMEIAVRRISYLETGAVPLHAQATGAPTMSVFYQKYGALNQVQQAINTLVPGHIFPEDVDPNQYYRAAFMGYTESQAHERYTSINMTLPVFFYLFGGWGLGIAGSISLIVGCYLLARGLQTRAPALALVVLGVLYSLLSYFDFVTFVRQGMYILCTISAAWLFSKILGWYVGRWGMR